LVCRQDAGSTFQQKTNTTCQLACQPTVSRWFFRCLGAHLLQSPSIVLLKFVFFVSGAAIDRLWAHHTGDQPMLIVTKFNLPPDDITWMSLYSFSSFLPD
jgi:hypothetical protein